MKVYHASNIIVENSSHPFENREKINILTT